MFFFCRRSFLVFAAKECRATTCLHGCGARAYFLKGCTWRIAALLVYSVANLDHPLVPFVPAEGESSVCLLYGSGGIYFAACAIEGFTVLFNSSAASTAANELAELFRNLVPNI